jgi:hypothetical protein
VTPVLVDPLKDPSVPTLPHLPVPNIDSKQFDQKLSKKTPSQPQAGGGTQ